MATYTSTINGNWSVDATWGGGGHPSANDDIANIGHEVTYDMGDSAITWGNVTINNGGVLIFPTSSDSTLLFNATGILTINSGGELRAGTSGAPIDSANHCYIHFPQGAAVRNVFVLNDGGTINIYGDADYYGSETYANLNADWTAGQTFYVTGDFSSKWQAGQKFYIHENKLYSNYVSDGHIYTIDTVGAYDSANNKTPITIVEAAPGLTFTAIASTYQSKVIMLSRNVHLADPGATLVVNSYAAYTERIRFDNNQAVGNDKINIQEALFYGWERITGGYHFTITNIIFASCNRVFNDVSLVAGSAYFISNYNPIYGSPLFNVTGDIASSYYGIYNNQYYGGTLIGELYSNNIGIYNCTKIKIEGNLVSNSVGCYNSQSLDLIGDFILNSYGVRFITSSCHVGSCFQNTNDYDNTYKFLVKGDLSSISHTISSDYRNNSIIYENCDVASVNREIRIYKNSGTILPLISSDADWQTPDSENDWILQLTPNSYCATTYGMDIILSPINDIAVYANAGSHTITFKIYPNSWTTPLDQDDVYIKASYLASSDNARTDVQTSSETYANAGWRECTVSFTTGQEGIVYFNLYFTAYEAAKFILIDPQWVMKSKTNTLDVWSTHGILQKFSPVLPASNPSLEGKIYDTLTASAAVTTLVSDRIYPGMRPQNESRPSLVYSRIGGRRENALGEGYTELENPRITIEVYATAIDARRQTSTAIISAMEASTRFSALAEMAPVDIFDPVTEEYKRILDFSIWNNDT